MLARVIYCYNAEKLPYGGGLYDQPASFVHDFLYLSSQVQEKQKQEDDAREAEMQAVRARGGHG